MMGREFMFGKVFSIFRNRTVPEESTVPSAPSAAINIDFHLASSRDLQI